MRALATELGVALAPVESSQSRGLRLCGCLGRPGGGQEAEPLLPEVLSYQDMLGAYIDPACSAVRLVHIPRNSRRQRARKDVLLKVGGNGAARDSLCMAEDWADLVTQRCLPEKSSLRRFLVFVNPASGDGSAPKTWRSVEELWTMLPGIQCKVVTTGRQNEAYDHVKSMELDSCDAIIVVSGDGLVHEVWNGLAARSDAKRALQLPIGHIPGGSGNGLASSVLRACGESYGVLDMAFIIAKGGKQPITLMSAKVGNDPPRTSFLSLAACTISDIDLGSEGLRCLGGLRFTVWAVWRVIRPLKLRTRLTYWPADAPGEPPAEAPAIDSELPGEPWVTIEDEIAIFWGVNTASASYDSIVAPGALLNDGLWHLVVLRGEQVSRSTLLSFFLRLETGTQVELPGVEVIRCKALRLVPLAEGGLLSLDGEHVPTAPVQVWPLGHEGYVLGR